MERFSWQAGEMFSVAAPLGRPLCTQFEGVAVKDVCLPTIVDMGCEVKDITCADICRRTTRTMFWLREHDLTGSVWCVL